MRFALALLVLLGVACDDDSDDPDLVPDATVPHDASPAPLDAHRPDAYVPVAPVDAGVCGVSQRYAFAWIGGLPQGYVESYVLEGVTLTKTRTDYDGTNERSCEVAVDDCRGAKISALERAMTLSNVIAAFRDDELTLGYDHRPWDGALLRITRADGKQIQIGDTCLPLDAGGADCPPIPEGVDQLRTLFGELAEEYHGVPVKADAGISCAQGS